MLVCASLHPTLLIKKSPFLSSLCHRKTYLFINIINLGRFFFILFDADMAYQPFLFAILIISFC